MNVQFFFFKKVVCEVESMISFTVTVYCVKACRTQPTSLILLLHLFIPDCTQSPH